MQPSSTIQEAVSRRRSSRLAKKDQQGHEALKQTPVLFPVKRNLTSLHHAHPPTIATNAIVVLSDKTDYTSSPTEPEISNPLYQVDMAIADKENMTPFVPQLYDRIKQNPRKATKKACLDHSLPRPISTPRHFATQAANMSVSVTQLNPLQAQARPAANELVLLSTANPIAADSDPISQQAVSEVQQQPEPDRSPDRSSARGSTSAIMPEALHLEGTSWSLKRNADPECDSQPPTKRSRSISSRPEQSVPDNSETAPRATIEAPQITTEAPQMTVEPLQTTIKPPQTEQLRAAQSSPMQPDQSYSSESPFSSETPEVTGILAPSSRAEQDTSFIQRMHSSLDKQSKRKTANVGKRQARRILELLKLAKSPDHTQALFLSGEEAKAQLQANVYFPGPIFTQRQQPLDLQTIEGFLAEQYNDDAKVFIQDPSVKLGTGIAPVREITIGKLKETFGRNRVPVPYNCLELAAHVEDGLRPDFLNTEDCRLLTKLKHPSSEDKASRRGYEPGWKEVEKWALLAKGGALTEPHQDSHGYSTYITVNQGVVGFGWLSNPTDEQRAGWRKNPATFVNGEWRYVVLRPGQTVYFPAGTVHFVFRHASEGDTLAFGGHVLRCSQIVRWVKTLLEEKETNSEVTNEDMSVSAPEYLDRVEKFVLQARKTGQQEKWGGEEAIKEFLRLKTEFEAYDTSDA